MTTMTKAVPDSPDALEEVLNDKARLKELMEGDGSEFTALIRKYQASVIARDPSLKEQLKLAIHEGFTEGITEMTKRAGGDPDFALKRLRMSESGEDGSPDLNAYKTLGLNREQRRQIAANGTGPGTDLIGKWPSLAHYLQEISPQAIQRNGIPAILKDLNEGLGGEGGFLFPEEFRAELLQLALESAVIRPRARVIPMGAAQVRIPAIRDTSHASTVYGGVTASWLGEAADLSSSTNQPTFNQILLTARKLTAYTVATNELLADSAISLETIINTLFATALAYFEDDAFIAGTGAGQPLGILNADALVSVAKETGQAATTVVYENILKMYARMLPQSLGRAVWICQPDVFPQIATMALNVGTGGSAVWLTNAQTGAPATILGRPLIISEKCKSLGTAGDIYFVDLGYYLIGDRMAMSMDASPHVKFTTDEIVWRFTQRVDGRPWILSALTPRNGTNTLSPIVALATRS